ncbi:Predicted arabinose efflux permease, MFS family [Muriicola jejuensis]|uniref:MFS transporter n=1 Tax=Muriicola jejuensis TaxID=504488 RepID=A0A6P0UAK1_9FLAO|nr:MFS transporter [Muriicola jejuensis]NER08949.1 MFS transporter [Muriicola jejuensis]SMP12667.1 Predicted arabinose efflux permease, MFS family [Muriicola jejuensis]
MSKQLATWLNLEVELRSCEPIEEEYCKEVPGNFLKNACSGFCSKLAEQLVSPSVTLPWILSLVGSGTGLSGMLVPLKNLGSLLPQLMVSGAIRKYPIRKFFWAIPAFLQALMVILMGLALRWLDGFPAGVAVVFLLLLFSIASGVSSVAFKDVMGKTIPKGKRGRLLAWRATGGGVLTLLFGLALYFYLQSWEPMSVILLLVGSAAALWILAGVFFSMIKEGPGATGGGRTPMQEFTAGIKYLKKDANLRNFVLARAFLMAIPLAQPFFVIIGRETTRAEFSGLGIFVIASGIAAMVSSPFWGRFADRSSRKLMLGIALFGIVNCSLVLGFMYLSPGSQSLYLFAPLILLNMMAHGGARLSRKTYLTDFAPEEERPLYIALSNTLIGCFTLLTAGIGFIAEWFSYEILLFFFMGMLMLSMLWTYRLREV